MARPRAFDEDKVIAAIKQVFWEKGYEGTSYADLMAASGLHKGSLYQAFGDKRALYLRALADYDAMEVEAGVGMLLDPDNGTGKDRIALLLNNVIGTVRDSKERRGCFLCNAAIDQAAFDQGTKEIVQLGLNRMQHAIEIVLTQNIRASAAQRSKIAATASQVLACYFGMRMMAKAELPISMLEQARDAMLNQLAP